MRDTERQRQANRYTDRNKERKRERDRYTETHSHAETERDTTYDVESADSEVSQVWVQAVLIILL